MTTLALGHSTAETGDGSAVIAGYVSVAEITIDAPASAVWPHVLDMGSRIRDFHFEHAAGICSASGEVKHLWPIDIEVVNGTESVAKKDRTSARAMVLKMLAVETKPRARSASSFLGDLPLRLPVPHPNPRTPKMKRTRGPH